MSIYQIWKVAKMTDFIKEIVDEVKLQQQSKPAYPGMKQMPSRKNAMDAELEELLAKQRATIKVVGCGGAGNNTINRITEVGVAGAETIAINTDAQDLLYTSADKKILIGKELTHGLGAGSIPKIGEDAARETEHDIKKALEGAGKIRKPGGGFAIIMADPKPFYYSLFSRSRISLPLCF